MKKRRAKFFTARTVSNIIVVCIGVLLYLALNNIETVRGNVDKVLAVIKPFIAGIGVAFLLNMPMRFFERTIFANKKRKRLWAILLTLLVVLLVLALLIYLIAPQIVDSVMRLARNLTTYLDNLNSLIENISAKLPLDVINLDSFFVSYKDLVNQLVKWASDSLPQLLAGAVGVGSSLIGGITSLIAAIYMLASKEKLILQSKRALYTIFPQRAGDKIMHVGRLSNSIFSGFISGKLIDSAIIAAICFVFMSIMNILSSLLGIEAMQMPYAVLISVIIGITNIIPFFGPFIGAIPSVMILLMVNPLGALWFIIFVIVLQQFDGNVLGPRILGQTTGLPAMWVLVAIIVGGGLFGFNGMLFGVPTTAVLYSLGSDIIENSLKRKGLNKEPELVNVQIDTGPPANDNVPYATHIYENLPGGANGDAAEQQNAETDAKEKTEKDSNTEGK